MANQYADRIEAAYDGFGTAQPHGYPVLDADKVATSRAVRLCSASVHETAGAPAIVRLWSGGAVGQGELIDTFAFVADEAQQHFYGDRGILCPGGVSIEVDTGDVAVSLAWREWMGDGA